MIEIKIDIRPAVEVLNVGIRRASAFARLGLTAVDTEPILDLSFPGGVRFNFWPVPLPEGIWENITDEYSHWIVGSCLKEIDHYFSVFLDRLWLELEKSNLAGTELVPGQPLPLDSTFAESTNVASKLQRLSSRIEFDAPIELFRSVSNARNALTHGLGHVRERDMSGADVFTLRWRSIQAIIRDGEDEIPMNDEGYDTYLVQSEGGATIEVRYDDAQIEYQLGEKISLGTRQLSEILFFYHSVGTLLAQELSQFIESRLNEAQ